MKRSMLVVLFLACMLASCASPTPLPSQASLQTSTSTPLPTPTATQGPMIEVGGIQVPDPKISNPELFDKFSTKSPIVQFCDALKEAGITIDLSNLFLKLKTQKILNQFKVLMEKLIFLLLILSQTTITFPILWV